MGEAGGTVGRGEGMEKEEEEVFTVHNVKIFKMEGAEGGTGPFFGEKKKFLLYSQRLGLGWGGIY